MSHNVRSLKPAIEMERFFDTIYGVDEGWVYMATKDNQTGAWEQYFYEWPREKSTLINQCHVLSGLQDVYYAPALFANPSGSKAEFKSSRVLWADFDGNAPAAVPSGIPAPSIKVRSSTPGHEHWYWILDNKINSLEFFEDLSQRLAYYVDADRGCWNANRVLRPPKTIHHTSGLAVELIRMDTRPIDFLAFAEVPSLPIVPASTANIGDVPSPLKVLARRPFLMKKLTSSLLRRLLGVKVKADRPPSLN